MRTKTTIDKRYRFCLRSACAFAFAACTSNALAQTVETVTVIGTTPVSERGVPARDLPGRTRQFEGKEIAELGALDLSQFLNRVHGSVFINEAQSNPLQPDVQLRGFTASPLLGLPQGIAVYQNGVRLNEPFGDTVNWALVPANAIDSITVNPGSMPAFGMNALGGAIAVDMKDGFGSEGAHVRLTAGDFSRRRAEAHAGGTIEDDIAWFVAGSYLEEDGWRDFSPTRANQAFADLRYRTDRGSIALGITHADTDLIGNGPAPIQLLHEDRTAIFTRPDRTENEMSLVTLSFSRRLSEALALDVVASHRTSRVATLNGDDTPFQACDDEPGFMCEEEGEALLDQFGSRIAFAPNVSGATLNRSETEQASNALSAQLSLDMQWLQTEHRLNAGLSAQRSRVRFRSSTELGRLDDTRRALGSGILSDEGFVDLRADLDNYGIYATDTIALSPQLSLNAAARLEVTKVVLRDQLGTALNGDHRFQRLNPALGLTWKPLDAIQLYASASEASRAPSPVELTCADPNDPCRLPNAFLSDPPLDQVVSRTFEAGARAELHGMQLHLGVFRATNRDDILFISAGALTNEGYFDNVGRTRREGIEAGIRGALPNGRFAWYLDLSFTDAHFMEAFSVASAHHPLAVEYEILVEPGDRIPSIPRALAKLGFEYSLTSRWDIGGDFSYASSQYVRGDEANLVAPVAAHGVLNLRTSLDVGAGITLFALLENATNKRYATFGTFGEPDEVLGEEYDDARFISPGRPRGVWVGLSIDL